MKGEGRGFLRGLAAGAVLVSLLVSGLYWFSPGAVAPVASPPPRSPIASGPGGPPPEAFRPAERLGPLDGAHLTATVDAFLYTQKTSTPLDEGQRRRAAAMVRDYLAACDVSEDATARFNTILTGEQRVRLKSYPGGAAVDFAPPDVMVGRVLQLLEKYRPPAEPPGAPNPGIPEAGEPHQSPKMIRILEGLYQMLQDPACDLSETQVREAHEALVGTQEALVRMREVDVGMREILTQEQIRNLPPDIGGAEHDRSVLRALEAWLADGEAPAGTRGWDPPARRQPFTWSLMSLGTGLVVLEQTDSLHLTADQRARLLAQVRESLRATEAVVAASHRCLGALTPDQWKAIYASPVEEAFFGRFAIRRPQDALDYLVEAYGARAAAQADESTPVDGRRFDHTTPPFIRLLEGLNYLERKEDSPARPTAAQARVLHDALAGVRKDAALHWEATPALFALLTPEQTRYLQEADMELDHEQNYVATLLLMLHLER